MVAYMKQGLINAWKQPFALLVLFLYRFTWGIVIYHYVNTVVVPLMHRYPGNDLPAVSMRLFLVEGQFQLTKTNLASPYLWMLAFLFLIRMVITPFLSAGVYYSVHHSSQPKGRAFFRGIKRMGRFFSIVYVLQLAFSLAPLIWIYPRLKSALFSSGDYASLALDTLPLIGVWLLWSALLTLISMYAQFGRVSGYGTLNSLLTFIRHLLPIIALGFIVAIITGTITLATLTGTLAWASLSTVIIHQAYYFIQSVFKLWGITSQHMLWLDKMR